MADQTTPTPQPTGTGFANIAGGINSLLTGIGGDNGIGDDIGTVVCSFKGNCVPKNVTNVYPGTTSSMPPTIWLIGGAVVIVILILVLKK